MLKLRHAHSGAYNQWGQRWEGAAPRPRAIGGGAAPLVVRRGARGAAGPAAAATRGALAGGPRLRRLTVQGGDGAEPGRPRRAHIARAQAGVLPRADPASAPPAAAERVHVQFVVPHYQTSFGQVLKVVGALEELGAWSADEAPTMSWCEGHLWVLSITLPAGSLAFKVVMDDGGGQMRWEDGGDRHVVLPSLTHDALPVGSVGVACTWGHTEHTPVKAQPDPGFLRRQLAALEVRVSAVMHCLLRGPAAPASGGLQVLLVDPGSLPPVGTAAGDGGYSSTGMTWPAAAPTPLAPVAAGQAAGVHGRGAAGRGARTSGKESALSWTVRGLLQRARDVLSRDEPGAGAVVLGVAESEAERAAALLRELQAATAALEQETAATEHAIQGGAAAPSTTLLRMQRAARDAATRPLARVQVMVKMAPEEGAEPGATQQRWQAPAASVAREAAAVADGGALVFTSDALRGVDACPGELLAAATVAPGSVAHAVQHSLAAVSAGAAPQAAEGQGHAAPAAPSAPAPAAAAGAGQHSALVAQLRRIELTAGACRALTAEMAARRTAAAAAADMPQPTVAEAQPAPSGQLAVAGGGGSAGQVDQAVIQRACALAVVVAALMAAPGKVSAR
ncbi:MAG: hypothetical protein J3K34DRAFT_524553 [Monoraphidium minutum]|nr:MAG: hypothetical protein J3K34DRAFT_524553 [Monoraphidium minutum]